MKLCGNLIACNLGDTLYSPDYQQYNEQPVFNMDTSTLLSQTHPSLVQSENSADLRQFLPIIMMYRCVTTSQPTYYSPPNPGQKISWHSPGLSGRYQITEAKDINLR